MEYANALVYKVITMYEQGKLSEASALLEEVLALAPSDTMALQRLAALHSQSGDHPSSLKLYQYLVNHLPGNREIWMLLGVEYAETGDYEQAVDSFLICLNSGPANAVLHQMIGIACNELGRHDEALQHFSAAYLLNPEDDTALTHFAKALIHKLRISEAEGYLLKALTINPANALAFNSIARIYKLQGRSIEAVAAFRKALELDPYNPVVINNLLLCLNYIPGIHPETLFAEHQDLCAQVYGVATTPPQTDFPHANVKLRIGYVSGDFHNHSVAFFFEPVLLNHDHQRFTIFCYSNDHREDDTTRRLKATGVEWRSIVGLSDELAAEKVRSDAIDILVDLSGHSSGNRLGLFALKPAPVQVSWLGYPHSTGLKQIDYFLTDELCDPPGMTEHLYTEKLVRLPGSFSCYLPPLQFPAVSPPPVVASGVVTFGSFNNFAKVNDDLIGMWARILTKVPDSRLFLKSMALGDHATQQAVLAKFQACGINADRIALLSTVNSALDHLALYAQIDIALDTYPYHGTTTTCEALWQGVPVITLAGATHAARVGVSLLSAVGCQELIAENPDDYVNIAVTLAGDLDRILYYRENLRSIMAVSSLMNATGLTKTVERVYSALLHLTAAQKYAFMK